MKVIWVSPECPYLLILRKDRDNEKIGVFFKG